MFCLLQRLVFFLIKPFMILVKINLLFLRLLQKSKNYLYFTLKRLCDNSITSAFVQKLFLRKLFSFQQLSNFFSRHNRKFLPKANILLSQKPIADRGSSLSRQKVQ